MSVIRLFLRSDPRVLTLLAVAAVAGAGCVYHPQSKPVRPAQALTERLRVERETATAAPTVIDQKLIASRHAYAKKEMTIRTDTERTLKFTYYVPKVRKPAPVIVCLPIMGGDSYPVEEPFASAFARHGYASLILHRPDIKKEIRNLEDVDVLLRQGVQDTSRVIDWLETQPNIDATRVGLFGVSLGAIRGTLVLAFDERIKAGVLGLAGGNLPYIMTHCADKRLVKAREQILERNGLTMADAEEKLREAITLDPLVVAPAVDPSKVMMVIAACDRVVPPRTGWELRRKLGDPETIELWSGHYGSVIHLPYLQRATRKFFDKKLVEVGGLQVADR